jgi:hypothetical protein
MITTDVMVKKKRNTHYVNNRDFLDALVVYKKECSLAKENGTPRPRIPHYIGECFLKIATHYAFRPNWANYCDSFVELVGWVITEGYIEFTPYAINIALSQNEGHKADRIRKCLKTLNLPHREYSKPEKTKLVTWAIKNHPLCGEIVGVAPDKVLSSHFILSLTHRQRLLLIDTMVNADGTTKSDGSRHYYQKCKKNIDQFIFLCTISGLTTSTKFIDNYVSFGKITHYYNVRIYINPIRSKRILFLTQLKICLDIY